ncbi:hypothetical protein P280DRAFT_484689 [Massarina eburnea CBS 473.64]|uniref:Mucin-like protein n=1 Tax=Massarina eburnea CBS 473.64 TaxID=1395130 RepID=A0A6A6RJ17_9PLEO|nr:hypothetical protein P280DRAFT_484689 [Massarina eburnea CBS 473.64]
MTRTRATAPCSHAEYEALPEPLKRKCFSSVERLRIEEEHALHENQRHIYSSPLPPSRASSVTLQRSITVRSRRRLRKAESVKHDHLAAQADAQFFLSLPEKVKRSAFSREEQILLVGSYTPSPLPLLRRESSRHSSSADRDGSRNGSRNGSRDHANHFGDFQFDFAPERGRPRTRERSSSFSSVSPTRASELLPQQDQDQDPNLDQDDQTAQPAQDDQDQDTESSLLYLDNMSAQLHHRRPSSSYRRTLSLTHLPLAIRTSTSSAPLESQLSNRVSVWHQRAHSASGRHSSLAPATPVFDPEATHYRDPEARKKLRTLASPQKFDEAVEFGFAPSKDNRGTKAAHYQLPPISTDARNFSRDVQTFLNDDRMSFLEDDNDEDKGLESDMDSMVDLDSPVTPSSGLSLRCNTRQQSSNFSSIDSNGLPAHHPMAGGRFNREMTLRMTLTRPDLRADEDQLYGWQAQAVKSVNTDPFALEELQLTDDMTGSKSPFYVKPKPQGNLVTRLFKRASKKNR